MKELALPNQTFNRVICKYGQQFWPNMTHCILVRIRLAQFISVVYNVWSIRPEKDSEWLDLELHKLLNALLSKPVSCPVLQLSQELSARPWQVEFADVSSWNLNKSKPGKLVVTRPLLLLGILSFSHLLSSKLCKLTKNLWQKLSCSSKFKLQPRWLSNRWREMQKDKKEISWVGQSTSCNPADWNLIRHLFTTIVRPATLSAPAGAPF